MLLRTTPSNLLNKAKRKNLSFYTWPIPRPIGLIRHTKILGAVNLQFYKITGENSYQEASIAHLVEAAQYWRKYADVAASQYEPQVLARNSRLDWIDLLDDVLEDVEIAREGK